MAKRDAENLVSVVAADVSKSLKGKVDGDLSVYSDYVRGQKPIEWVSSGNYAIDRILGGGYPVGRTIEIFGPYSSGKSVLLHEAMAQVCKLDGVNSLQDTEATYDAIFGGHIGINPKTLFYNKPDTIEDAFLETFTLINSLRKKDHGRLLCIGLDSLAATSTKHEMKELEKSDMTKAKMIGAWLRRVTRLVARDRTLFIVVNQVRQKVGVMFGNPETTPGGDALPFHSSQRIRVQHMSLYKGHPKKIIDNGRVIGVRIVVDVVKSKVSPPFRKCEVIMNFTDGLVRWSGLADLLADENLIKRISGDNVSGGSVFEYETKRFQSHEIEEVLDMYPDLCPEIKRG